MDSNGDGQIDFNEFLAAAYDRKKLLSDSNIKIAFDMFDKNKKGYITQAGLRNVFGTSQSADKTFEETWTKILSQYDSNGDGKISFEEFKDAMQKAVLVEMPQVQVKNPEE